MPKIKIYTCQRMTGRLCSEMYQEAQMLKRTLENYGFEVLNPVIEENVPNVDQLLEQVNFSKLENYWKRDKEMIRESDIVIDYMTQNKSDGSNKEVGYNRYCLWKPTVRIWNGPGGLISQIEDDIVVPTLAEALILINDKWGTYEKLGQWRMDMWTRCYPKWLNYQRELMTRYGMVDAVC